MFSRDILQSIAQCISDPFTFETFALVNRQCAQIVRELRVAKIREFLWTFKQHPDIYRIVSRAIRPTERVSMTLITGKYKSGKSTLMRYIVRKTKQTHELIRVSENTLISRSSGLFNLYMKLKKIKKPVCLYVDINRDLSWYLQEYSSFLTDRFLMEQLKEFLPTGSTIIAGASIKDNTAEPIVLPDVEHLHLTSEF